MKIQIVDRQTYQLLSKRLDQPRNSWPLMKHRGSSRDKFYRIRSCSRGQPRLLPVCIRPGGQHQPTFAPSILVPDETVGIKILQGASLESNPQAFVPKNARGIIGVSNKITWTNADTVMHSVTSDNDYVDPVNGKFDSIDNMGTLIGQN